MKKRLMYSQNEDDDTRSRYQKIPLDDGSQFNLGRVQDRRMDGRKDSVYDPQGGWLGKGSGEKTNFQRRE